MEKATIKFKNGETLEAEVNGGCFITDAEPAFPVDLSEVEVEKDDEITVLKNVEVVKAAPVDSRYWFALREMSESEIKTIQTRADIDYIAMMSDIEL